MPDAYANDYHQFHFDVQFSLVGFDTSSVHSCNSFINIFYNLRFDKSLILFHQYKCATQQKFNTYPAAGAKKIKPLSSIKMGKRLRGHIKRLHKILNNHLFFFFNKFIQFAKTKDKHANFLTGSQRKVITPVALFFDL